MSARASPRRVVAVYLAASVLEWFVDMTITVTCVLLLEARGLSGAAVFGTIAAVWILEGLFEVPTGIAADMIGRRASVLVSFALRAFGYLAVFFSSSPAAAIAGTLVAAAGGTFASGALEAWTVDELGDDRPESLDRLFSRARVAENTGLVTGVMTGAAAATLDLAAPYLIAGLACAVALAMNALLMTEHRASARGAGDGPVVAQIVVSSREVLAGARRAVGGDKVLVGLVLGTATLWLCRGIPGAQWAAHFQHMAGGSLLLLGLMRSASSLLEIPLLMGAIRLAGRRPAAQRWVVATAACVGGVSLAAAALARAPLIAMVSYVCFSTTLGLCLPAIRAAMNERIEPQHRATVLSVSSLFSGLFTGGGLLVAAMVAQHPAMVRLSWPVAAVGFTGAGLSVCMLLGRPQRGVG